MARVLISSLGVGRPGQNDEPLRKYSLTDYKFPGEDKKYATPFVAAALIERFQVDRLYLIGTSKSMWEEVYVYFTQRASKNVDEDYWTKLGIAIEEFKPGDKPLSANDLIPVNQAIDNYLFNISKDTIGGSRCLVTDYGLNEKELWRIFDVFMGIMEELGPEDKVFLDITHSFRSIPLFIYLMLDLMKILQFENDFKLGGLYYGMQDVIRDFGHAPVIDLSFLYNITNWARGAYNFTNFGNGYLLAELIKNENIADRIRNISNTVDINYINDFKREVDALNGQLDAIKFPEPIVRYMEPYLRAFIDRFKGINSKGELQFSLAKWYFDNKRFAQGYICLAESIITRFLEVYREYDSSIKWGENNRRKIKNLIFNPTFKGRSEYEKIYEVYEKIRESRNAIAHASVSRKHNRKHSFTDDIQNADKYFKEVEKLVFNPAVKKIPEQFPFNSL